MDDKKESDIEIELADFCKKNKIELEIKVKEYQKLKETNKLKEILDVLPKFRESCLKKAVLSINNKKIGKVISLLTKKQRKDLSAKSPKSDKIPFTLTPESQIIEETIETTQEKEKIPEFSEELIEKSESGLWSEEKIKDFQNEKLKELGINQEDIEKSGLPKKLIENTIKEIKEPEKNLEIIKEKLAEIKEEKEKNIKDFQDYFKNQGNKEYILWFLYDKIKSGFEIDEELKLPKTTTNLIIDRNSECFEIDHKEGNKKFWKLSEKGKFFIENLIKEKEKISEEIAKSYLMKEKEEQDFYLDFEDVLKDLDLIREIRLNKNPILYLDFEKLAEINPRLSEMLLIDYENAKDLLLKHIKDHYEKEVIIRPFNLPSSCEINLEDLSSKKHKNRLIKSKAIIEYRSDSKEEICFESVYECASCGTIITLLQNGDEFREPKKCNCGRRGGFRLLQHNTEDFLEIIIKNKEISGIRIRINLELRGNDLIEYLNKNLGNGKTLELIGTYKLRQKYDKNKKINRFSGYLIAENIKSINDEVLNLQITEEDKKEIEKIAEDFEKNGFENILDVVFPSVIYTHIGQEVLSKAFILQEITSKNSFFDDGTKNIKKLNVFCYGDPATKKSKRIEEFNKRIDPNIRAVNGSTTSTAGLLLGMDTFENKRFISGGLLAQSNNSIIVIDEIQKFDREARGSLHDVLASQKLRYTKVGFQFDEDIDVCMSFFGNPKGDVFGNANIYSQIQQEKDNYGNVESNYAFLSRCDLVIGIRDIKDKEKDKAVSLAMQKRGDKQNFKYNLDLIRKFFWSAKNLEPKPTEQAQNLIANLISQVREDISTFYISNRITEAYSRLSECFAKLRLSEKIEEKDVLEAHKLYLNSLKSIDVIISPTLYNFTSKTLTEA